MKINEAKTRLDTPESSGKTTYSPEQIQALCAQNSYLKGWLEAFYLSDWNNIECKDRDSISIEKFWSIK